MFICAFLRLPRRGAFLYQKNNSKIRLFLRDIYTKNFQEFTEDLLLYLLQLNLTKSNLTKPLYPDRFSFSLGRFVICARLQVKAPFLPIMFCGLLFSEAQHLVVFKNQ